MDSKSCKVIQKHIAVTTLVTLILWELPTWKILLKPPPWPLLKWVDQRGRDSTERAEHSGYHLCGCQVPAISPWALNWEISPRCESPWDSSTGWKNHQVCNISSFPLTICSVYSTAHPLSTELPSACRKLSKMWRLNSPYAKGKIPSFAAQKSSFHSAESIS